MLMIMRNLSSILCVTFSVLMMLGVTASCEKDTLNPSVEDLPSEDFQYSVLEKRQLKQFT